LFKIRANFVGSFKVGDNINHNLRVLTLLYSYFENVDNNKKRLLCKPIILIIISIIEAVLHDFHGRIRAYTKEGVSTLAEDVINYIRGKHIDELEKYIMSAKKHDFFDMNDTKFYDTLDSFRKLRNRIHIQNTKNDFESDEYVAFNEKRKVVAEKLLEKTLVVMSEKYSRNFNGYVQDFELPWDKHFHD
jgi:hypothetical protein